MSNVKVAIQGAKASFHDVATKKFFQSCETIECQTFKVLCELLSENKVSFSVMAIENTIAGSILTNYSLLERYRFKIVGEVYLRIEMNLMALKGQSLSDINFVQSHPMALLQCEDFFFKNPHLKLLESSDTAESARLIASEKRKGFAALGSKLAAETYGLEILAPQIETSKQNYTRFLIVTQKNQNYNFEGASINKASYRFETPNVPGGLADILAVFKKFNINMTKIQSVPILGKPYQYSIHVDIEWSDRANYALAKSQLEKAALNLISLGEYPRGEIPYENKES